MAAPLSSVDNIGLELPELGIGGVTGVTVLGRAVLSSVVAGLVGSVVGTTLK